MKKFIPLSFLIIHLTFFAQNSPSNQLANDDIFSEDVETTSLAFAERIDTDWMVNLYNSPLYKNTSELTENENFTSDILKQRLEELNHNTPFPIEYNASIERFIRLYLETKKTDISNLMDKSKYYFPIFEEYLDKYDLPLELKYLAVVESALKPNARSVSGAKGLWQFMYHTGKQFGLNVTSYVDQRSDPIKSTEAACKYLKSLYKTFNDWDLALAAYNSGPGNVSKAIRRSGGLRNYWNIRQYLPAETRGYVPAFYTTLYLFEYGASHHIYSNNTNITFFETDTIHVKKKLTFQKIQKEIGIDKELLKKLNPQYKLGIVPVSDKNYVLTLPKSLIGKFVSNENTIYDLHEDCILKREESRYIKPNKINSYIVQRGDNLPKIAKKFAITLPQLKKWNGLQTDYLISGQRLVISTQKESPKPSIPQHAVNRNNEIAVRESIVVAENNFKVYTVEKGDSLFLIAKKFPNTTVNQIRNWNNIWGKAYIKPGTQLKILTIAK